WLDWRTVASALGAQDAHRLRDRGFDLRYREARNHLPVDHASDDSRAGACTGPEGRRSEADGQDHAMDVHGNQLGDLARAGWFCDPGALGDDAAEGEDDV